MPVIHVTVHPDGTVRVRVVKSPIFYDPENSRLSA